MFMGSRPSVSTSILDTARIHQGRKFDGSLEMPLHPWARTALTNTCAECFGHSPQSHEEEIRAGYGLAEALELGARLDHTRDQQSARAGQLVVFPERGQVQ